MSRWRVLTSYLLPSLDNNTPAEQRRDQAIHAGAQLICQAFEPWARGTDNARLQNLVSIMKRASEFGVTLFSQPAMFEWQWQAQGRAMQRDGLQMVVMPGLDKTTDQEAQPLASPLHLLEPSMASPGVLSR